MFLSLASYLASILLCILAIVRLCVLLSVSCLALSSTWWPWLVLGTVFLLCWWSHSSSVLENLFNTFPLEKVTLLVLVTCSLVFLLWLQTPELVTAVRLWKLSLLAWIPWPKLYWLCPWREVRVSMLESGLGQWTKEHLSRSTGATWESVWDPPRGVEDERMVLESLVSLRCTSAIFLENILNLEYCVRCSCTSPCQGGASRSPAGSQTAPCRQQRTGERRPHSQGKTEEREGRTSCSCSQLSEILWSEIF